jgi:hypothetical protein
VSAQIRLTNLHSPSPRLFPQDAVDMLCGPYASVRVAQEAWQGVNVPVIYGLDEDGQILVTVIQDDLSSHSWSLKGQPVQRRLYAFVDHAGSPC